MQNQTVMDGEPGGVRTRDHRIKRKVFLSAMAAGLVLITFTPAIP